MDRGSVYILYRMSSSCHHISFLAVTILIWLVKFPQKETYSMQNSTHCSRLAYAQKTSCVFPHQSRTVAVAGNHNELCVRKQNRRCKETVTWLSLIPVVINNTSAFCLCARRLLSLCFHLLLCTMWWCICMNPIDINALFLKFDDDSVAGAENVENKTNGW